MASLDLLVSSRKYKRKLVTILHNKRETFYSLSQSEIHATKSVLKDHFEQLQDINNKIQSLKFSTSFEESDLEQELEACENYFTKIRECTAILELPQRPNPPEPNIQSLLKSPTAPLPKFESKDGEDLTKFFVQFEETISRYSYPEYDKLLLLKQQISGRALTLVNSLEADQQGYIQAKELLLKALASPETQKRNVLKQLTKLTLRESDDPFEYISKMRNIMEGIKRLNIDIESVMQYFFWEGLNESFRNHLTQITNKSRPSLDEINEHFFEACERYLHKEEPHKRKEMGATALAANVNFPSKSIKPGSCVLCHKSNKESSHYITRCPNFDTPSLKVEHLKKLGGCVRCAQLNHSTNKCKFRFKMRCFKCNAWHMTYLCLESPFASKDVKHQSTKPSQGQLPEKRTQDIKQKDKSRENKTNNNVAVLTHLMGGFTENSILPTCTGYIFGSPIRILKDSGSQSNFVAEDIVDHKFDIIKSNCNLTINGINGPRNYSSNLVEFNLAVGEVEHQIRAFTLPHINIDLNLPKLSKVVKGFTDKGYKLADRELLNFEDGINNIKLILGSKSEHCIPVEDVIYGVSGTSVYSKTPGGILLKGDVDSVLNDLTSLPFHDMPFSPQSLCCVGLTYDDMTNTDTQVRLTDVASDHVDDGFSVIDESGNIIESELLRAANEILINEMSQKSYGSYCSDETHEVNDKLVKFVLENTTRGSDGRLIMPLMWNARVSHLLSQNKNLAICILRSTLNKFGEESDKLKQIDKVFKEQEDMGIIEKMDNLDQFLTENPSCSFLPFMGVFKPDRDTTKCRVVFLSNLKEKSPSGAVSMSHNQVIHSGPSLNQKLHTSVLNLRFGSKLCCFDLKKAFNMIGLNEIDQNKLLFLWFRNIDKGDFSVIAYRNKRLSFGLRCSPATLMLALFKILILDQMESSPKLKHLKKLIYHLSYMDNCAFTSDSYEDLVWSYRQLTDIFRPYGFELQQFCTNDQDVQTLIDSETETSTEDNVKLLGLQWQRSSDGLSTRKLQLNVEAKTKREILSTVASQFDPFGYNAPLLNRARLFLHELQCSKEVAWDDELSRDQLKNWVNIAKQVNAAPVTQIERSFGARDDEYSIIAFADSSKTLLGSVIYLKNESKQTVHFVSSKNKIVGKSLDDKSIPSLELQALAMTTENLVEIYQELVGGDCVMPIYIKNLTVYSDSLVAIAWLNSYSKKLDKTQKLSVFVQNRLERINKLCENCPVTFSFVSGFENPADCVTRALSHRQLSKSNFFVGPPFLTNPSNNVVSLKDTLSVTIPCYTADDKSPLEDGTHVLCSKAEEGKSHLIPLDRFSRFHKLVTVHKLVLMFINKLKLRLKSKLPEKFAHFEVRDTEHNYFEEACRQIIRTDQEICFPEVYHYLRSSDKKVKNMPNIVSQLNIFLDNNGMLRVRNKLEKIKTIDKYRRYSFPLLISKSSNLAILIIRDMHIKLNHAGYFSLLAELRKQFWIPCFFSIVKKVIKPCVLCKRFRERTIKLNQSPYRERRIDPVNIPYSNIYIDFMGPFYVKQDGNKIKVWILCITCMWSRAVNLKVCRDLSTREFLRSLQLHCFEYGVPQHCISDLGTQFTAGANIVQDFLKDHEAQSYFHEHGLKPLKFEQYFKGQSQLGSLVEVCVKMTKRLLFGAIRNNVVDLREFEFLVCETVHLVNRRPVAFKDALGVMGEDVPDPITPEKLIHGHELLSLNLIPELERGHELDWDVSKETSLDSEYEQIRKVRLNLIKSYNEEFLKNLIHQATDKKTRYKPVVHKVIKPGDIVLIKDEYTKINNYPMAVVQEVVINDLEEVTGAILRKGKNCEVVKRHVTTLIPLLTTDETGQKVSKKPSHQLNQDSKVSDQRPKRKTAMQSKDNFRSLIDQGLV